MEHVQRALGAPQRQACRALGQPRSTQRYAPRGREEEGRLVGRMLELVGRHPRYGYRRIWALLRAEGWRVNRKRVHRLWRREGLKVPRRRRRRRRLGSGENACARRPAERPNHVWAWDFIHDRTAGGGPLKWFSVVDEHTRKCLALEAGRRIASEEVIEVLARLFREHGTPQCIRSDGGPEFIAKAIRDWLSAIGVEVLYVEPGSPWENGYAESFHSRLRDELLNVELFTSVREARAMGQVWRREYNHERPHSALGYLTPAAFAARCTGPRSATLREAQCNPVPPTTLIAAGT